MAGASKIVAERERSRQAEPATSLAQLCAERDELCADNTELRTQNSKLRAQNAELQEELCALRQEVQELQRRLGLDSSNSSKPPAAHAQPAAVERQAARRAARTPRHDAAAE